MITLLKYGAIIVSLHHIFCRIILDLSYYINLKPTIFEYARHWYEDIYGMDGEW